MQQLHGRKGNGQVLVLVALSLLVLLGIVALAVDGGNLYAERRKMQNAADAGALAGARVLCYEEHADLAEELDAVTDEAELYAIDYNGAEGAVVTVSGGLTVTVVATETATTFFARVIGFPTADVTARASAMCQGPEAAGGLWPLAVRHTVYTDTETIGCGDLFYAYISNDDDISVDKCDFENVTGIELPDCYDSDGFPVGLPDVGEIHHLDQSQRGWLDLYLPDPPYINPCKNENCGKDMVGCWIQVGHPGPIAVDDCVDGEGGGMTGLSTPIDTQVCEIHNLILFDRMCVPGVDALGGPEDGDWYACKEGAAADPGEDFYHVTGFGCMRVMGWYDAWFQCEKPNPIKAQVVIVQKLCESSPDFAAECITIDGTGSGGAPSSSDPVVIQLSE